LLLGFWTVELGVDLPEMVDRQIDQGMASFVRASEPKIGREYLS